MNDTNVIDQDPPETEALALRKPATPVTLSELAALKGEAVEIIEARVLVLETLRKASIRATSPEDWLLFKSPDEQGGQIVGYLQDCGCDRVRDLYGIEIFEVSKPEKVVGNEPGVFHYLITGSGRCKLTRQVVEAMEGGRSSTDDVCRGKSGAELELLVRKAGARQPGRQHHARVEWHEVGAGGRSEARVGRHAEARRELSEGARVRYARRTARRHVW
jgi:hypothetical protein